MTEQDSTRTTRSTPIVYITAAFAGVFAFTMTGVALGAWPYDTMRITPELATALAWIIAIAFIGSAFDVRERLGDGDD